MQPTIENKLAKIKMLVLDVDGTMTDGGVYLGADGSQMKKFDAKDGRGLLELQKTGMLVGIISASKNTAIVYNRAEMLGVKYVYSGDKDKVEILSGWLEKLNLKFENIAYIGDDVNDLKIMGVVGLKACPQNAVKEIKAIVDIILELRGGEGAIREFIDTFLVTGDTNLST